uniref:Secreted RxLR effector peptide protein n=1 Tax=Syphacia muris TaxID=451379 RepID=A0A0N5ALX2_9BILA
MNANMRGLILVNCLFCIFGNQVLARFDGTENYRIQPVYYEPRSKISRPFLFWKRSHNGEDMSSFWKREVNRDKLVGFQKALQFGKRSQIKPYDLNDY